MSKSEATIAERLELHNLAALVKSARAKQTKGKPLTKREIAAVAELEKRQSSPATPPNLIDIAPVVQAFMEMAGPEHEQLVRAALANVVLKSMDAVAQVFGVAAATVRGTWKRDGMPGTARRGTISANHYSPADILVWWINRKSAAGAGRQRVRTRSEQIRDELDQVELEAAKLRLVRERSKNALLAGELADLALIRAEFAGFLTQFRDAVLEIPRHIKPMLPANGGEQIAAEVDRCLRNYLIALSERCFNSLPNQSEEHNVDNGHD